MSYGIMRVQKFGVGSVKGIEIHDRRDKTRSHTNKEINRDKSNDNYDLHPTEGTFRQFIKKRIEQLNLPKAVRKDAVVMAQVLVTSDEDFFKNKSQSDIMNFFKQSYEFLSNRYGAENTVSCIVHMDEKTPHMHFNFVPVTDDGRLSAKSVLARINLIKSHDDFFKEIGSQWGLLRGEKGGYKKHIETTEFKKKTAYKALESVQSDLKRYEDLLSKANDTEPIQGKKALLNPNKVLIDASELDFINELKKTLALYQDKIIRIKDFERKSAHAQKALQSEIEDLKAILKGFEISERKLEKQLQDAIDKHRNLEKNFDLSVKKALQEKGMEFLKRFDDIQGALKNAYVSIDLAKESILKN